MTTFVQPLDLKIILGNLLAGSKLGLSFLILIFLGSLAGRFRMPNAILLILVALMPIIVASYFLDFWLISVMLLALFIPYTIVRLVSR